MEIPKTNVLSRAPNLMCVDQQDNNLAIILPGEERFFFVIDGLAADCFRLIDGKLTVEQICEKVCQKHSFPLERVISDFQEFSKELVDSSLVQVRQ